MIKFKSKLLLVLIVLGIITTSAVTVTHAAGSKQMLEAWFGLTNITYKGQDVTWDLKPFAVNEITYVPLRKVAELFDKNISWDQATRTVILSDKNVVTTADLQYQILVKDAEIAKLRSEIESLQEELEDALEDKEDVDLDDLEDELNDEYDRYEGITFDISLSGDEDDITVKIEFDEDKYEDEWDDLSTSEKIDYLEEICEYILDEDEYEDADIEGYIRDEDSSEKLLTFYTKSNGTVKIDSDNDDLDDLEDELNDEYDEYEDISFDISLSGDEDDIEVEIEFDLDKYEDEWDELRNSEKASYIEDICDDIWDEFEDADITGYIEDSDSSDELLEFYTTSSGKVIIDNDGSSGDLADLEDDLYDEYVSEFDDIEMTIDLEEDSDDEEITFILNVDLDEYSSEYYIYNRNDKIEDLMYDIYRYIEDEDEYEDYEIKGYVYDTDEDEYVAEYYKHWTGGMCFDDSL